MKGMDGALDKINPFVSDCDLHAPKTCGQQHKVLLNPLFQAVSFQW
jgi:hypothetical protein